MSFTDPNSVPDYKLLYEEQLLVTRELQSRVTRFAATEQELINTRNRIDSELRSYKCIFDLSSQLLGIADEHAFFSQLKEAIIDVCEVEYSLICISDVSGIVSFQIYSEGLDHLRGVYRSMDYLLRHTSEEVPAFLNESILKDAFTDESFAVGIYYCLTDSRTHKRIQILGVNSQVNAPLYPVINERQVVIFGLLAQHATSIWTGKIKSHMITDHVMRLSASENELKKLSLIATKTKNGVIITDALGRIEWVNQGFETTTGYTLSEVIGKKPGSLLQRHGIDAKVAHQIGQAIREQRSTQQVIVNFTKTGQKYYNQLEVTPVFSESGELINYIGIQKDITAEVTSRNDLININKRFELIAQASGVGIWEFDIATKKLIWDDGVRKMYQHNSNEDFDLLHVWRTKVSATQKVNIERLVWELTEGKRDRVQVSFDVMRDDDQQVRTHHMVATMECDDEGMPKRLIGSVQDITEEEAAEKKLRLSEEKYRGLIDCVNLGLAEFDGKGHLIFRNQLFDALNKRSGEVLVNLYQEIWQEDQEQFQEHALIDVEGREMVMIVSRAPMRNDRGEIIGEVRGVFDITDNKELEQQLELARDESRELFQRINNMRLFYETILNQAPAELLVIDEDSTFIYGNDALFQRHPDCRGLLDRKLKEQDLSHSVIRDNVAELLRYTETCIQSGKSVQYEEWQTSVSGERLMILRNVVPYQDQRIHKKYALVSGVDITTIKQYEERLLTNNTELSKINAELDQFVYSLSHDLRSPLLAMKGLFSLIHTVAGSADQTLNYLSMAESSVEKLDNTIQEILAYSYNARRELEYTDFSFSSMVDRVLERLRQRVGFQLAVRLKIKGMDTITGDSERWSMIMLNLMDNAWRFKLPEGPEPRVDIQVFHSASVLEVQFKDNGQGIEAEKLDRVFEMFYRGHRNSMGAGLGLYICKEVVERMSGTISVQSVPQQGTTFTIRLPLGT